MALINENNSYSFISGIDYGKDGSISLKMRTYKDKDTRDNPGEFDLYKEKRYGVQLSSETVNAVMQAIYVELKKHEDFENSTDDI